MIEAVEARLETLVPELAGRIQGAAEFSAALRDGAFPRGGASAFLIPMGLQGGQADAVTGHFSQEFNEVLGVLLTFTSADATGEKALKRMRPIVFAVIEALAGWAPSDEVGIFRLLRGGLTPGARGQMTYQLDFSIQDQLRIST